MASAVGNYYLLIIELTMKTAKKTDPVNSGTEPVDYANDPHLSVATRAFLNILNSGGGVPLESLSVVDARNVLVNAQQSVQVDLSGIDESEKLIEADGFPIKLNIVRPQGINATLPVFIFIHGGGWILGDYPTHRRLVRDLVVLSGCAAVFVNYTPTPDRAFPTQINEIYAATKWVAANGAEINVDGKKLAIVGNSVGGNMSTVTCLQAKDQNGPEIKLQVLMWPIVDADFETGSYHQFGKQRFLTTDMMKWMYDMYIPETEKRKNKYASPLQASIEDLKGLPPALIQVAENDILRDEGEAYGRKLDEAGVKVTTLRYNGAIHDFGMLNGLAETSQARALVAHAAAALRKYLS